MERKGKVRSEAKGKPDEGQVWSEGEMKNLTWKWKSCEAKGQPAQLQKVP